MIVNAANLKVPGIGTPIVLQIPKHSKTAIYGPQKTALLRALAGRLPNTPADRLTYPSFGKELWPSQAIHFMNFADSSSSKAPFIGARYESFRDEFDLSLLQYLQAKAPQNTPPAEITRIAGLLSLDKMLDRWFVGLSNGQSRRAQLAVALLRKPRLLIMDEPFLGLDPKNQEIFRKIIHNLPIPVIAGLKFADGVAKWATQFVLANKNGTLEGQTVVEQAIKPPTRPKNCRKPNIKPTPAIELNDLTLGFNGAEPLFEHFSWKVMEGERVRVRGPNGSGKSTLLALLTADHPKSWSCDLKLFGQPREVGKSSYVGINREIGHSSPEIHAIYPKNQTAGEALSTPAAKEIATKLQIDLQSPLSFGEMPMSEQKLILFARALAKTPKLLILDEAFSTLEGEQLERAFGLLDEFEGTVLVIAHADDEVPYCDSVLDLV